MNLKLQNPTETIPEYFNFEVMNMTTNIDNFYQNEIVDYDLADADVTISNTNITWSQPFDIIDTLTPT
jgi:hypothetical protein